MTDAIPSIWTHVVYADNFCAFAKTKVKAEEMRDLVWEEALRSGLVVHETFCSSEFEFLFAFSTMASRARSS